MFSKIRRAVTGLVDESESPVEDWEMTKEYESTIGAAELQAPQVEERRDFGSFAPGQGLDNPEGLVKAAIESDGVRGEYRIPVWWLKAVLADLEGRVQDSKELWARSELVAGEFEADSIDEQDPGYGRLFPGDAKP